MDLLRHIVVALAAVLIAGCGSLVRETWEKPGVTQQNVNRDVSDCDRVASVDPTHGQEQGAFGFSVRRNERAFTACMRSRGYELRTSSLR
jgi:uncharacterized protein YceK